MSRTGAGSKMAGSKRSKRRDEESEEEVEENLEEQLSKHRRPLSMGGERLGKHLQMPTPRVNATWTASPRTNQIILFGGEHYDGKNCQFYDDLFVYEIDQNEWYRVATSLSPGPRSAHQAVWGPDGCLYMFGGEFGTSKETRFLHYRDFWRLDITSWAWESLSVSPLPPSRSGHRMAVWRDYIVLFGGFIDTNGTPIYLDDLWLFSFASQSWRKVDWLNVHMLKPTPRSAFQFAAYEEGVVLYGGYCQVKGKSGVPKGQVLNDIWLLKMEEEDLSAVRWEKRKTASTAPLPRSGCASSKLAPETLAVFGGVFDEDIGDEFIQGTCSNELHLYNMKKNKWEKVEYGLLSNDAQGGSHQICPRFNAMLTTARNGSVYAFGGIWEIADIQYSLDDLYRIDPAQPSLIQCIKPISVDLSNWNERIEAERREMMESDDSDDADSDEEDEEEEEESDDEGEDGSEAPFDDNAYPKVSKHFKSLKDYFDAHSEFWLGLAKTNNPVATDKDLRKEAFLLAKAKWDEAALITSVENL